MMSKLMLILLLATKIVACAEVPEEGPKYIRPESLVPVDGFDDDPIGAVQSLSGGLTLVENRITAYVKGARRISVIDANSMRERWGREVGVDFKRSFHIPSFDGVAVFSNELMRLVTENDAYEVDLAARNYTRYARSNAYPLYVFVESSSGETMVVENVPGKGIRQQLIFSNELQQRDPTTESLSVNYVPLVNATGTMIIILETYSGSYARYKVSDSGFAEDPQVCHPAALVDDTADGPESRINLQAAALHNDGQNLILASAANKVLSVNIAGDCQDIVAGFAGALELDGPVSRFNVVSDSEILATVGELTLVALQIDGSSVSKAAEYFSGCEHQLVTGNFLTATRLLAICLNKDQASADLVYAVDLIYYDQSSKEIKFTRTINEEKVSRFAVDKESTSLFFISNQSFGKVEKINLETSEQIDGPEFVLEGLLDKI